MLRRLAVLPLVLSLLAIRMSAQGLETRATKDDWEEINFEYNSSVLVDGFPSLLRLAELLKAHPGYKVQVEGHTDRLGSNGYNDKLGMARANSVRDFLVKYGASANQIQVSTRGKLDPKYAGQNAALQKQLADLKNNQDALQKNQQNLESQVNNLPKPPTTSDVANAVTTEI